MDTTLIVIIVLIVVVFGVLLWLLLAIDSPFKSKTATDLRKTTNANLRQLVDSQRSARVSGEIKLGQRVDGTTLAAAAAAESGLSKHEQDAKKREVLGKKLMYARLSITPLQFRIFQAVCVLLLCVPGLALGRPILLFLGGVVGYLMSGAFLDWRIEQRFKAFDIDYPVMLLSLVGLLKTGMNTLTALEAAGKGLPEGSLVRREIELMLERIRLGLAEAQAIGAFGEEIPHPEIELFVQALILSTAVGGKLSDTLERLSKQVRKRQQFRKQAVGAVAMERGSLHIIGVIMTLLMIYLSWKSPELVMPAFKHPTGQKMYQWGLVLIILGFIWSRRVSRIKV